MTRWMRYSPGAGLRVMSRRMPLEVKLPLLMSVVLALVLSIALIVTFTTIERSAVARAVERLQRSTRQLATLGVTGIAAQHTRFLPVVNDSAIHRELRRAATADKPAAATLAALQRLVLPTDSGMPVELWTADGRRVAFVGNDVRFSRALTPDMTELPQRIANTASLPRASTDSLRIGPLYAEGERVYFWFVMPIRDRNETIGYIAQQRALAIGPNTERTLRELSGDSVSLYYRNIDDGFWASGVGQPKSGLVDVDTAAGVARDSTGGALLMHEERIGRTPLVVGMHVPRRFVVARSRLTLNLLIAMSVALMLGGTLAAWAIGRSVARPLGEVTRAAGALASGDYSARVPGTGDIEVRRLADSFNHMAAEIGASRDALERQTAEARAANSAKSEFLTTMSHELRTPLNAIGGYVELLELELRGPLTDAQRRDLQRIKASQQHLLGLISSVLDLGRIEAGQIAYALESVAIDPFLADVDALVAPQAAAKSVQLVHRGSPDIAVIADREKLRQILLNLLSNAIRHTPAGGVVTMSAEAREGRAAIVVEDTGPGIPPEKREVIFEPFVQLDRSLAKTREGLGLGLAISRDLARGMAGELTVEGNEGGARFVLTLHRGPIEGAAMIGATGEMGAVRATR